MDGFPFTLQLMEKTTLKNYKMPHVVARVPRVTFKILPGVWQIMQKVDDVLIVKSHVARVRQHGTTPTKAE